MSDHEMREMIRRMLTDWAAATSDQRAEAPRASAEAARRTETRLLGR